jgi:hypothetical protein
VSGYEVGFRGQTQLLAKRACLGANFTTDF